MVGLHRKFRRFIVGLVPTLGVDRGPTRPTAGRKMMRVMIKFALPVESSNTAIRTGKLQKVMQQIAEDLKPEAAYFFPTPTEGQRGGFFIVEMQESSQIADMAERFFFGLNAKVEFVPVMSAADLEKGLSGVQATIEPLRLSQMYNSNLPERGGLRWRSSSRRAGLPANTSRADWQSRR